MLLRPCHLHRHAERRNQPRRRRGASVRLSPTCSRAPGRRDAGASSTAEIGDALEPLAPMQPHVFAVATPITDHVRCSGIAYCCCLAISDAVARLDAAHLHVTIWYMSIYRICICHIWIGRLYVLYMYSQMLDHRGEDKLRLSLHPSWLALTVATACTIYS